MQKNQINFKNLDIDESIALRKELIEKAKTTSFTLTPTQWVKKTGAVGMYVKQGKGGGVMAHPDIASDFRMWLDPSLRLALVKFMREQSNQRKNN